MKITHDIIAAVVGPGWRFGLSRILINEDNEGAVFIAGSETPHTEFTVTQMNTSRGTGVIAGTNGGEVTWRRRGSSCQYKLAKCKISTETMTSWWEASQTKPEGTEVTEGEPEGGATAQTVEGETVEGEVVTGETVEGEVIQLASVTDAVEPDATRGDVVEEPVEPAPKKRTRRTKAQIEADNAAASEKKKLEELL